ncbi:MAG: hypothetical protein HFJ33_07610 [Clostridia bacterium]|nr:hypothetical protein [Clostridia bacterium]
MDIKLKNGGKIKIEIMKNEDLYEYYMGGRKIGVCDPKIMKENILILQNTLGNELAGQIRDEINLLDKTEIQKEAQKNKEIQDYAKNIGIEKIRNIYEVDIPEETEEITTSDISIKQSIELSERANDLHDLKKWLGGNIPSKFTKLVVIDSADMKEMKDGKGENYQRNSTRYDLALVDQNHRVEPLKNYIPELEQRSASGSNPTAPKYQVDKNGEVEKDAILSEYEIAGKIIQIDNKEMGRVEVNIGQEEHSGNETMGVQLRDSNSVYTVDTEVRRVLGEYERNGQRTVDENLKEIKKHEEQNLKCDPKYNFKDIDGEIDTVSEGYFTEEYVIDEKGNQYSYQELATRWGKYADGKPDVEATKDWLQKEKKENPQISIEDLLEKGDEEHEDPRAPEAIK